jgi:hypothetical protein
MDRVYARYATFTRPLSGARCARPTPVDAFEQHRQLCLRSDTAVGGLRPDEAPALKPLGQQAQTITTPPQHLEHVAAPPPKHEHVAAERVFGQRRLHLTASPFMPARISVTPAASHILVPAGKPIMAAGSRQQQCQRRRVDLALQAQLGLAHAEHDNAGYGAGDRCTCGQGVEHCDGHQLAWRIATGKRPVLKRLRQLNN